MTTAAYACFLVGGGIHSFTGPWMKLDRTPAPGAPRARSFVDKSDYRAHDQTPQIFVVLSSPKLNLSAFQSSHGLASGPHLFVMCTATLQRVRLCSG